MIIPTRNEAANVHTLIDRVRRALDGENWTLIFVDDSDDDTPDLVRRAACTDPRVRLIHRRPGERTGGLGGAVLHGFAAAATDLMIVMDGDLQHPPESLPALVRAFDCGSVDIAVASRYAGQGSAAGLSGRFRHLASRFCQTLSYLALHRCRATSDPMSGFFGLRRKVIEDVGLAPNGFKILLEILIKGRWDNCLDVPYIFAARTAGRSKSDLAEARSFLTHVRTLRKAAARVSETSRGANVPGVVARSIEAGTSGPLRIMIFTSESAPVVSGIATCVNNLQRMLDARGHSVTIVSRAHFARLIHSEVRISAFAFSWRTFRRQLAQFDVVNVHGPVPTMSEVFLLLSRTLPKQHRPSIVYTHHSDLAIPGLGPLCSIYNRLTAHVAKMADVVLVSSEGYAQKFTGLGGVPVEVIPWAVDTEHKVRPRAVAAPDRLRVLFVGQLRRYKGVHLLLEAISDVPDIDLTVIGDGPERAALERAAAGRSNVTFRGRVSDAELWRAYSEHDVVTLPSLTSAEAYGLVVAEGMAAGCVPVASDLPGVREVAGPTGVLVTPGSAASVRAALLDLVHDRAKLERLAHASVARAEGLSLHAAGERHEQVFRKAVERRIGVSGMTAA